MAPVVRLMVFPIRLSPVQNVRISSLRATTHERVERVVLVVLRFPERVEILDGVV